LNPVGESKRESEDRVNIEYLREFVILAGCLNYTLAAQQLFISQSALTRHIKALEKQLGVSLLERSTHMVALTPAGEALLVDCISITAHYDSLLSRIETLAAHKKRELKLGMLYYGMGLYYAHPLVLAFREDNPLVSLTTLSMQPSQMISCLHSGAVDAGVNLHSRFTQDKTLEHQLLGREKLYALVLKTHPLATRASVTLEELARESIVLMRREQSYDADIRALFHYHDIELRDVIYTEHIDTVVMALTGESPRGVFIGTKMLSSMTGNKLTYVPIESDDFWLGIALLYPKDTTNPAIIELAECARQIHWEDAGKAFIG
jgi:DNA-binding transcriptional LysR family regulator